MKKLLSTNLYKQPFVRSLLLTLMILVVTSSIVYASGGSDEGSGHGGQLLDFGWRVINFVILVGLLYWLLKDRIKVFFSGRRTDIKLSLEEAMAAKEEAEKRFEEYSAKLDKATEEISEISEMIRAQGLAEKEKIIENAKITAERMKRTPSPESNRKPRRLKVN